VSVKKNKHIGSENYIWREKGSICKR